MRKLALAYIEDKKTLEIKKEFFDKLEKNSYETYVFLMDEDQMFMDHPLKFLESIYSPEFEDAIFITDNLDLSIFCYRFFHEVFSSFYLILKNKDSNVLQKNILSFHKAIISQANVEGEDFYKNTNRKKICVLPNEDAYIRSLKLYLFHKDIFTEKKEAAPSKPDMDYPYTKEYILDGRSYHLVHESKSIQISKSIHLLEKNGVSEDFSTLYAYPDKPKKLVKFLSKYGADCYDNLLTYIPYFKDYLKSSEEDLNKIIKIFENDKNANNISLQKILLYLYSINYTPDNLIKSMDILINGTFTFDELRFMYVQLLFRDFTGSIESKKKTDIKKIQLHKKIYDMYIQKNDHLYQNLKSITPNKKRVLVITTQFTIERHAPTRRAIDYCINFMDCLGYEILLINTLELNAEYTVNIYEGVTGNYREDFATIKKLILDENHSILFNQFNSFNYSSSDISKAVDMICEFSPMYVMSVTGSGNIFSDAVGQYLPNCSITCGYDVPIVINSYPIICKGLEDDDYDLLKLMDISKNSLIYSEFTFKRPKTSGKAPEKDDRYFDICVVSNRLEQELNEDEISILDKLLSIDKSIRIVFFGELNDAQKAKLTKRVSSSKYSDRYIFAGFQEDILYSFQKVSACYNFKRNGGGSSLGQAMLTGLPVVSHKYGDGSYVVGREDCFDTQEKLVKEMKRLFEDKAYYKKRQEFSLNRANKIYNTKDMIINLDKDMKSMIDKDDRFSNLKI